ncbi:MAG: 3-oxoacid CoA-transferase subunit B [Fusobacterium gastrosuis]|uniref:3-oxoacid CoA-transferase subunit B n=1 Tax=Fusobacterium gastrosuis TaxID=1755100 RepID=UPI002A8E36E4|nr:3-oxoacid CoA-transferase subunit B [Fusobacterium gastrosuis]
MARDMDKDTLQNFIAKNVATLIDGGLVNLGIGLPTRVPNFLPEGANLILHSENGFVGIGPSPKGVDDPLYDPHISNAGGLPSSITIDGAFFDSNVSFGIVRGGHLKATVLGALQVDKDGNLANYMIPGKMVPGMGGAMDLVTGAELVIVAMEHTQKGSLKILNECSLPLTGKKCVDWIVTEMGVIKVTEKGLLLTKKNKDYTVEEIQAAIEPKLMVAETLEEMLEL